MEIFEIFPLKITRSLGLLVFTGVPRNTSAMRILFDYLGRNSIATAFLAADQTGNDRGSLALAIGLAELEKHGGELDALKRAIEAEGLQVEKPVAVVRVLGHPFDIRPGIAGRLYGRLSEAGVRLLANSITITSSLLVVPDDQIELMLRTIRSIFRLPEAKSTRN